MRERIADHIALNGPMPFDVYMEWCLYDSDEGFFSAGPMRSAKHGDFVTSPEISWAFGVPVGEWAERNAPSSHASLIEVGAGSGTLLRQVVDMWTMDRDPIYAVERSAEARRNLAERFDGVVVMETIDEIPREIDVVIVANEVLDNMPAALARRVADGWVEIAVGIDSGALRLVDVPARVEVQIWCDDVFGDAHDGAVVSVQLAVSEWIDTVFDRFGNVSMCLIDYGGTAGELVSRDPVSVVRTYRKHQSGADWLQHPGETDITVDVNVDGVVAAITRAGGTARVMMQRDFCLKFGLEELIADAADLERIAAKAGDVMGQLTNRSERLDFEALIDPEGLGGFQVLLAESRT